MTPVQGNIYEHPQRPLTEADALILLASWQVSGNLPEQERPAQIAQLRESLPEPAYVVAQECHHMPLALALCAALVREGLSWASVLDALHKANTEFRDHPHAGILKAFQVSLDELRQQNPDDARCYLELAVFPESTAIPEVVVLNLWSQTHQMDESQVQALIDRLSNRVLIRVRGQIPNRRIELHPMLRTYLQQRSENLQAVHTALLEAYQKKCPNGWATGPNDGYFLEYLGYHLCETGRRHEWYELLISSPEWMEAKFGVCLGDTSYSSEVNRAIADFSDPLTADQILILAQLHAALQVWYARIHLYEDHDLKTLVWLGRDQEALTMAHMRGDHFNDLLAIYQAQKFRNRSEDTLLGSLLPAALRIQDEAWQQAEALEKLVWILVKEGRTGEALEAAQHIPIATSQAKALCQLASALAQSDLFDRGLEILRNVEDEHAVKGALVALIPVLAPTKYSDDMLDIVQRFQSQKLQVWVWRELALFWEQRGDERALGLFQQVRKTVDGYDDVGSRSAGQQALAAVLIKVGKLAEAEEIVEHIEDKLYRAEGLHDLALALVQTRDERAEQVLNEAEEAVQHVQNDWTRTLWLGHFSAARTGENVVDASRPRPKTLEEAQEIQARDERTWALRWLALDLAQNGDERASAVFAEMETSALRIQDYQPWEQALRAIAVLLIEAGDKRYEKLLVKLEEAARLIGTECEQEDALENLARLLAQTGQYNQVLAVALSIPEGYLRSRALEDIVEELVKTGRYDEAEDTASQITDERVQPRALYHLAIWLAEAGLPDKAENAARNIQDEGDQIAALIGIAFALSKTDTPKAEHLFDEIKGTITHFQDDQRPMLLGKLSTALARLGRFDEAAQLATNTSNEAIRAAVLAPIVTALAQSGRYDEAKEAARRIQLQNEQASALRALACALVHAGYFDQALEIARSIQAVNWRVAVLQSLALIMHQKGDERGSVAFDEVKQIIDGSENRSVKADRLLALLSALLRVGDERAESIFPKALEAARSEEEDEFRAENLHKLALALSQAGDPRADSVFREALAATENVPTEDGYQWVARTGVASAMAEARYIAAAFSALDGYSTEVLETIASWRKFIDAFQPHLSIQIIQHVLRIMGWVFPDWHEIHELLLSG